MSKSIDYIENRINEALYNTHTAMPCRVERRDGDLYDVKPLFRKKIIGQGTVEYPLITGVPAQKQKVELFTEFDLVSGDVNHTAIPDGGTSHSINSGRMQISWDVDGETETVELVPDYSSGDIVLCVFAERALDNVLSGQIADPGVKRKHDIKDAVIIGGMPV